MCGIAGFIDFQKKATKETLIKITEVLHHRGPDDTGYFFQEQRDCNIGLGHKRLSIIDTSSCGHQPMHFQNLSIIYNGEVYNYQEIQNELIEFGYNFTSTSDTEVILKALHKWGTDAIQKFNGMFAIAIYDHETEELILIRDRMGVKPLYYYHDGQNIVFASELKSIINYPGFNKSIAFENLYTFLFHGYIPAPQSIFKNVFKLLPGSFLKFKRDTYEINKYWNLVEEFERRSSIEHIISDESAALAELEKILLSSVRYRMVSDVPLGAFLSGGYDSSIVTAIMQHFSDKPIKTFTIGFNEKEFNEAKEAKKVANYLHTDHHELYLSVNDAKELIPEIPKYFDEPFGDSSMLPTMLVSRFARENVTVALTGDGGDELFCGYRRYDLMNKYEKGRILKNLSTLIYSKGKIKNILSKSGNIINKLPYLGKLNHIVNVEYLLSKYYIDGLIQKENFNIDDQFTQLSEGVTENLQERYMLLDMLTYLPDDILTKVDRASMSTSLEGREPLLDYRLVEFSFNLSHYLKYKNGEKKYLLKKLAHNYIPKELLDRPKRGFALPIYDWIKTDMHFLIDEYLSRSYIEQQGIFNYTKVEGIVKSFKNIHNTNKFGILVWHLLIFQIWYEHYFK